MRDISFCYRFQKIQIAMLQHAAIDSMPRTVCVGMT